MKNNLNRNYYRRVIVNQDKQSNCLELQASVNGTRMLRRVRKKQGRFVDESGK